MKSWPTFTSVVHDEMMTASYEDPHVLLRSYSAGIAGVEESLGIQIFCCSPCRQHNKHLDHTHFISVSVKIRSRAPSAGISKRVRLRRPHHAHTFHARIPYCSILDAFPSSGCFILDEWRARVQHVSASWTSLRLFGRIFPNQCLPQQSSLAVRDSGALQHRRLISITINS